MSGHVTIIARAMCPFCLPERDDFRNFLMSQECAEMAQVVEKALHL
jgi:hypothetical protein